MRSARRITRRDFLQAGGTVSATAFLRLGAPALMSISAAANAARSTGADFLVLSSAEVNQLSAIADRIIPPTDTPGAAEAGVVHFFDRAFADSMRSDLPAAREGLAAFNAALRDAGHAARFSDLDESTQDDFLRTQERGEFFELVRAMTIFGFFAMSSYGGNSNHVGWDLLGFKGHQGAWSYPFGYYDAEYAAHAGDGD